MLSKLSIVTKNVSNKSCSTFNLLPESRWTCVSVAPRIGVGRGSVPKIAVFKILQCVETRK